jgi:hypothetical protein
LESIDQKVFENRVIRSIFGPTTDEVTGEWRMLHSEKLHNVYLSPNIIRHIKSRRMKWAGHVTNMGDERKVYFFWGGGGRIRKKKTTQKTGITMDLREIRWGV